MLQLEIFNLSLGEIIAYFQDPWVVGWVLIGSGVLAASWLLQKIIDPIPLLGTIFDIIIKIGSYLGFFIGALNILVGYAVYVWNPANVLVSAVLIIIGFSMVMRLLSKFPIALLFALAVAIFATFTLYGILAPYAADPFIGEYIVEIISLKWMAVIGVVIFCVVYVLGGFLLNLIGLIGKIFASTPVSIVIGIAAIAVGIIVLVNPALLGLVFT